MIKEVFAVGTQNIQIQHLVLQAPQDKHRALLKTPSSNVGPLVSASLEQENLSELLKGEVVKAGLVPSQPWMAKVEQLYALTHLKHGTCTCS